ncbi:hypothetical protein QTV44_002587 [Vibrio vulnificus]|nr:hypothetical protein [Vibrio vulnificus]
MNKIRWLSRHSLSVSIITYSFAAIASEESDNADGNMFNDGNNVSGLFSRLANVIRMAIEAGYSMLLVIGVCTVISGIFILSRYKQLQISPRLGVAVIMIGIAFGSPKGCSQLATNSVIKGDNQLIKRLEQSASDNTNDPSYIEPNQ